MRTDGTRSGKRLGAQDRHAPVGDGLPAPLIQHGIPRFPHGLEAAQLAQAERHPLREAPAQPERGGEVGRGEGLGQVARQQRSQIGRPLEAPVLDDLEQTALDRRPALPPAPTGIV